MIPLLVASSGDSRVGAGSGSGSLSAFEQAVYVMQGAAPGNGQVAFEQSVYVMQGAAPGNGQVAFEQVVYIITT